MAHIGRSTPDHYDPGPMSALVHLIRHGETHNPDDLVYASLPGFSLTERGRLQARAAAEHLKNRPVVAVYSSPLQRALETAGEIASRYSISVVVEPGLTEWALLDRWAGTRWDELDGVFGGELSAYLEHPADLDFAPETLSQLARRIAGVIQRLSASNPAGEVVVVSHQDPIQAARLHLRGGALENLHKDKPQHASVITLRPGTPWEEVWATGNPSPASAESGTPQGSE